MTVAQTEALLRSSAEALGLKVQPRGGHAGGGARSEEGAAVPVERDGKLEGLQVYAIRSGSMMERLGLQNGGDAASR